MDQNGRPSDAALLAAMKRELDHCNDNRVFLMAYVDELSQENAELKSRLAAVPLEGVVEPSVAPQS